MAAGMNYTFNYEAYQESFDNAQIDYTQATNEEIEAVIYRTGICNLYQKDIYHVEMKTNQQMYDIDTKTDNKNQEEMKKTKTTKAVKYSKCKIDKYCVDGLLRCDSKHFSKDRHYACKLHDFIPDFSLNKTKQFVPNKRTYFHTRGYVISTFENDVLIKPRNMQYVQCKSAGKIFKQNSILSMASSIEFIDTHAQQHYNDKKKMYNSMKNVMNKVPRVMIHYNNNKYEEILKVTQQFYIAYSIVCYI